MGCCQNAPPHTSNQVLLHGGQNQNNLESFASAEAHSEYFDQLYQKEKYVTMVIDKLDLDIQLLISKQNLQEGLFFFERKTLFQNFSRNIDNYLQAYENGDVKKKNKISENPEIVRDLIEDIKACSELNYSFLEWQQLNENDKNLVRQNLNEFFKKHLKLKTGEIEEMFREYQTNFNNNKNSSPLFMKK